MLAPLQRLGDAPRRAALLGALRRAYLLALAALAVPGLLIGVPFGVTSSPAPNSAALLGLGASALVCAALALGLAHRKARPAVPGTPEGRDLSVQAAIQAASAPAVPLLMACTQLRSPLTLLALLALTLLALAVGWASLTLWARRAGRPDAAPGDAALTDPAVTG
ncbi:hypothetical protein [Deinococcus aquiradiocola]|uniref:Uncharacterized protein n=1 Tax=Deinococcus aquiradiocola TaxID=393059 RepID=A0A917URF3_9DEIO|nr:hypothetical protein [Deinococcus aquiradiocola]GGJ79305.1 hypothetical protein GCM10008939_23920 [Deinococcus aquiradiocola]